MLRAARRAWERCRPRCPASARASSPRLALGMALIYNGQRRGGRRTAARGHRGARALRRAARPIRTCCPPPRCAPLWLREAHRGRALAARAIESARTAGAPRRAAVRAVAGGARRGDLRPLAVAVAAATRRRSGSRARRGRRLRCAPALAGLALRRGAPGPRGGVPGARRARRSSSPSARGLGFFRLWALEALAELELGLGRTEAAVGHLAEKQRLLAEHGIADPDVVAGARARRGAAAPRARRRGRRRAGAPSRRRAEAKGQPWSLARLARGPRAARRRRAERTSRRRCACTRETPDRFEEARTRLCHGERLRRARRRAQAREQLRAALDTFDELGAAPWADRARAELRGDAARPPAGVTPSTARPAHAAGAPDRA